MAEVTPELKEVKELNTYVIVKTDGTEEGTFKGKQPRVAALKVANMLGGTKDKPVEFTIRARGTKKLHMFVGWVEMLPKPAKMPAWFKGDKIKKAFVKKLGIEHPDKKNRKTWKELVNKLNKKVVKVE